MDRNTTKILIYTAANTLNAARMVGINLAGNAIRKEQHTLALNTPAEDFSFDDRLVNDDNKGININIDKNTPPCNEVILRTDDNTEIRFINALIDVAKNSDVKSTELVNRKGTVKERIQEKDYSITIKGSLMGERDKFPHDALGLLNQILSESQSISLTSSYTRIFKIDKVVFKTASFNQSTWVHFNVMPFTITFDSDDDYNFLLNE